MSNGKLFIVSAPSGAGKTTVVEALLKKISRVCHLERVVTYTTRQPRLGENEEHYHFMTVAAFEQKLKEGFFLEWSSSYGNYYGSPRSILTKLKNGSNLIMILDRVGAKAIKQVVPESELIWIKPPSLEVLKERLSKRGDSEDSIQFRLGRAKIELEQEEHEPFFNHTLYNISIEQTVQDLCHILCPEKY